MKINVTMTSESASKKAQANAKLLFGSKGATILDKLKVLSKEKLLVTPALTSIIEVVEKSADIEGITKFAKSVSGKALIKNVKALVSAKTMSATLKALKAVKVTKALNSLGNSADFTPTKVRKAPIFKANKSLPFLAHLQKILVSNKIGGDIFQSPVPHIYMEDGFISVKVLSGILKPLGGHIVGNRDPIYKALIKQAIDSGLDTTTPKSWDKKYFDYLMDIYSRPVDAVFKFPGNQILVLAAQEDPIICSIPDLYRFGN